MAIVSDVRQVTLVEAIGLFQEYAGLSKAVVKRCAQSEVRIQAEKTRTGEANEPDRVRMKEIEAEVTAFVSAHGHDLFRSPRKQKTEYGTFGLETATKAEVHNEEQVLAFAEEHPELELAKLTHRVQKTKVKSALLKGHKVPGARLVRGDVVVMKVDKAYLTD